MNLKVMSIVTGVLLLVAVSGVVIDRLGGDNSKQGRVGANLLENVDISKAGSIHVLSHEGEVSLNYVDGVWLVKEQDNFPAGPEKIQAFLFRLSRSKIEHKVTENPAKLGGLGLLTREENKGKLERDKTASIFTVKDQAGKQIYQLLIGADRRQGTGMRQTTGGQFLRFPKSTAAYLIPNPLFLERIPKDWLRPKIFDFEHKKLFSAFRIRQPGKKSVAFTRKDAKSPWLMSGVDAAKLVKDDVDTLARRIGDIEVSSVASPGQSNKALGWEKTAVIEIDTFDKRAYRMEIGLKTVGKEFQYVKLTADVDASVQDEALKQTVSVFNKEFANRRIGIYDWEAEQLIKTAKDLFKKKK